MNRFKLEAERARLDGLLDIAQQWYNAALRHQTITNTGHNDEVLDLHSDIKLYKQSVEEIDNQL